MEDGQKITNKGEKYEAFMQHLKKMIQQHPRQIIMGDFNTHFTYDDDGNIDGMPRVNIAWAKKHALKLSTEMARHRFLQKNIFPNSSGNYPDVLFSNTNRAITVEKIQLDEEKILANKYEPSHDRLKYTIVIN